MNVKYQIFVSSTYDDLKDERNEVIKACLNMGHIPVGMEMFNAADEEQWAVITRTIDQCDYYVVIVAHRYGSTTPEGISFTEKEYDYAIEQGVPVLGFIIAEEAPWPNTKKDEQQDVLENLKRFKGKVRQKMVRFWHNSPELRSQFVESLGTSINTRPRRGWTRAPEAGDADIAQILSNLADENARLRQTLDEIRSANQDDVSDVINLLDHEIGDRRGKDFFMDAVERSGGRVSSKVFDDEIASLGDQEVRRERRHAIQDGIQQLPLGAHRTNPRNGLVNTNCTGAKSIHPVRPGEAI